MCRPRKPHPPITKTEPKDFRGFSECMMIRVGGCAEGAGIYCTASMVASLQGYQADAQSTVSRVSQSQGTGEAGVIVSPS